MGFASVAGGGVYHPNILVVYVVFGVFVCSLSVLFSIVYLLLLLLVMGFLRFLISLFLNPSLFTSCCRYYRDEWLLCGIHASFVVYFKKVVHSALLALHLTAKFPLSM